MYKVGLTGGIGSGKTTVAHIFEILGIPVFYADTAAKILMNTDADLQKKIIETFGSQSYIDGKFNKPFLSKTVFANEEKTAQINAIIHPATIKNANVWMSKQTTTYAIKEAALIFEADAQMHLDIVIGVHSPYHLRLQRTMQRDNLSEIDVFARMQKQMDEDEKMSLCNFVINNNEEELLIPQVLEVHKKILALVNDLKNKNS